MEEPVVELIRCVRHTIGSPKSFLDSFIVFLEDTQKNFLILKGSDDLDANHVKLYNAIQVECYLLLNTSLPDFGTTLSGCSFGPETQSFSEAAASPQSPRSTLLNSASVRQVSFFPPELTTVERKTVFDDAFSKGRAHITVPHELSSQCLGTLFAEGAQNIATDLQSIFVDSCLLRDAKRQMLKMEKKLQRRRSKRSDKSAKYVQQYKLQQELAVGLQSNLRSKFAATMAPMYMDCKASYAEACRLLVKAMSPSVSQADSGCFSTESSGQATASSGPAGSEASFSTASPTGADPEGTGDVSASEDGRAERLIPRPADTTDDYVMQTGEVKLYFRTFTFNALRDCTERLATQFGLLVDYFSRVSRKVGVPFPSEMERDLRRIRSEIVQLERGRRKKRFDALMKQIFEHRKYVEVVYSLLKKLQKAQRRYKRVLRKTGNVSKASKSYKYLKEVEELQAELRSKRDELLGPDSPTLTQLCDEMLAVIKSAVESLAKVIEGSCGVVEEPVTPWFNR